MYFAFAVCFCDNGDLLSQWRGYAGTRGFAIGMDFQKLRTRSGADYALLRMLYDQDKQTEILKGTISEAKEVLEAFRPENDTEAREFAAEVWMMLLQCILCCKHYAFQEESEWRLLDIKTNTEAPQTVRVWQRDGESISYVELPFKPDIVTSVTCSPGGCPHISGELIERFLKDQGYGHLLPVRRSDIPLRWKPNT